MKTAGGGKHRWQAKNNADAAPTVVIAEVASAMPQAAAGDVAPASPKSTVKKSKPRKKPAVAAAAAAGSSPALAPSTVGPPVVRKSSVNNANKRRSGDNNNSNKSVGAKKNAAASGGKSLEVKNETKEDYRRDIPFTVAKAKEAPSGSKKRSHDKRKGRRERSDEVEEVFDVNSIFPVMKVQETDEDDDGEEVDGAFGGRVVGGDRDGFESDEKQVVLDVERMTTEGLYMKVGQLEGRLKGHQPDSGQWKSLRQSIEKIYCQIIVESTVFAEKHKLHDRLFSLFYKEQTRLLKTLEEAKLLVSKEEREIEMKFVASSMEALLGHAISTFESLFDQCLERSSSVFCGQLLCYLGDCKRYFVQHCLHSTEFSGAADCYVRALEFSPGLGKAWNQLAVMSRASKKVFEPCYYYTRSMFSEVPFASKENLIQYFASCNFDSSFEGMFLQIFRALFTHVDLDSVDKLLGRMESGSYAGKSSVSFFRLREMLLMVLCVAESSDQSELVALFLLQLSMKCFQDDALELLVFMTPFIRSHPRVVQDTNIKIVRLFRGMLARSINMVLETGFDLGSLNFGFWTGLRNFSVPEVDRELISSLGSFLIWDDNSNRFMASSDNSGRDSKSDVVVSNTKTLDRRLVVVDVANIAMAHGKNQKFSCKGIEIALEFYEKLGCDVVGFLPEYYFDYGRVGNLKRQERAGIEVRAALLPDNVSLLRSLRDEGKLVATPAKDYDDSYCLMYAQKYPHAVVVSCDRYRDAVGKVQDKRRFVDWIKAHVISYVFHEDEFLPNPDFVFPKVE
eukprot:TRINITY_DN2216_c0_g1_i1.p1 TRINITY_DN2216_c0_g1~~TRINITY_DN2216_c0_g1_i1.p1  ORF type:complete len:809 (-),score=213.44 TRINITY_DN2216_c0_g1_i1:230-2602(-)